MRKGRIMHEFLSVHNRDNARSRSQGKNIIIFAMTKLSAFSCPKQTNWTVHSLFNETRRQCSNIDPKGGGMEWANLIDL